MTRIGDLTDQQRDAIMREIATRQRLQIVQEKLKQYQLVGYEERTLSGKRKWCLRVDGKLCIEVFDVFVLSFWRANDESGENSCYEFCIIEAVESYLLQMENRARLTAEALDRT